MKTNEDKLTRLIEAQDLLAFYQNREVANATKLFTEILNNIKKSASKEIPISSNTKKIKPLEITDLINAIRKRDRLHS